MRGVRKLIQVLFFKLKSQNRRAAITLFALVLLFQAAQPLFLMASVEAAKPKMPGAIEASDLNIDLADEQELAPASGGSLLSSKDKPKKEEEPKPITEVTEDVRKRTETKEVFMNPDGTNTEVQYFTPKYFWDTKDARLEKIDTTLVEDTNAADSSNVLGKILGKIQSAFKPQTTFTIKENDWQARFAPSNDKAGMIRIQKGEQSIAFSPIGAKTVTPVITTSGDKQVVNYYDLFPGVNVEYRVFGSEIKQNLVLKDRNSTTSFEWKVDGAWLEPNEQGGFNIKGSLGDEFSLLPLNLILNNYGFETKKVLSQSYENGILKVGVDSKHIKQLPKDAFPAVIDPSAGNYKFGTRAGGNYKSYKSDGYICPSTECNPYAGSLRDSNGVWRSWRGGMFSDYSVLKTTDLVSAKLHLTQRTNAGFWTGNYSTHNFRAYHLTSHAYNAIGTSGPTGSFATVGDLDVTNVIAARKAAGSWNSWLGVKGEECACDTYKNFDPDNSYLRITYSKRPPVPVPESPTTNPTEQVTITTQNPQLRVSTSTDPDSTKDAIRYRFRVLTNTNVVMWDSNWNSSRQWILPDGILQDGGQYIWQYQVEDPYWESGWKSGGSFKVDLRTSKDTTQTIDDSGPVDVNLANGMAYTGIGTHSMNALGGAIGLSLNYESPVASRRGLLAEYFAGTNWGAVPNYRRVEPNINYNWGTGTPVPNVINADNFSVRWSGYFVAPKAGEYTFGAANDDYVKVTVKDQTVYDPTVQCYTKCWGSSVTLQEGEVAPIKVEYREGVGGAQAELWTKGPVTEQIVPQDWLRTAPYATDNVSGLTGRYYRDNASHNPTENDLFMVRSDANVNFDWDANSPVPGAPSDNFLTKWTGYYRAPADGSYTFSVGADDGYRLKINDVIKAQNWAGQTQAPTSMTLSAGDTVRVALDYYEVGASASVALLVDDPISNGTTVVESRQLLPDAQILPRGWSLSVDADGQLAYDHLSVRQNGDVILYSPGGAQSTYVSNGTGFKPPINHDAVLTRITDGGYRLIDVDGREYVFRADGRLNLVTSPADDRKPAALKYEYGTDGSSIVPKLKRIVDSVDDSRYGSVYYGGDAQCAGQDAMPSVPSGFDAAPMEALCAFVTTDGQRTDFFYNGDRLTRVSAPGNQNYDMAYDEESGLLTTVRDIVSNDAIAAGVRDNNDEVTAQITYDALARVGSVTGPAAKPGDQRMQETFEYLSTAGGAWTEPEQSDDAIVSTPVSVSWGPDRIDLFARGVASDLQHKWWDGQSWSAWESLGGCITNDPTAASWGVGRIDVFANGCNASGNNFFHKAFDNGRWYDWAVPVAGRLASSPSAVSWGYNRIDVVGRGTDNALYNMAWNGSWHGFSNQGGCLSDAPAITSWGVNRLDIFFKNCNATGNNLQTKTWANAWGAITDLGRRVESGPAAVADGTNKTIDLVAKDESGAPKHMRYTPQTGWGDFQLTSGCMSANPGLVSTLTDQLELFTRDCSGKLQQTRYVTPGGATKRHITGAPEPKGYSQYVEYDHMQRTTKVCDIQGLCNTDQWHHSKDLLLSSTNAQGLKTTTIYDEDDRPVSAYGPAPASWFGNDRKPLAAYASKVPRADSAYDEGINGLAATYYNSKKLVGAPVLHSTGVDGRTDGAVWANWGSTKPISVGSEGWGVRLAGKIKLPETGNHTFTLESDDGVRLYIDDKLYIDGWADGAYRTRTAVFNNTKANSNHRIEIEYYDKAAADTDAALKLSKTAPGGAASALIGSLLSPGYNLETSAKVYDSQLGDVTSKTDYGSKPEFGLPQSATIDPDGLNYTSNTTYEGSTQEGGFLRQTSESLPGGNTTVYEYYGADEAIDNPCTPEVDPSSQAGFGKLVREQDPDDTGPATSRTNEVVHDKTGREVATRVNNDPWQCTYYDDRGRTTKIVQPDVNGRPGRTIDFIHNFNGNPLKAKTVDSVVGSGEVEVDLLGRAVWSRDVWGNEDTTTYDSQGNVTTIASPVGTEAFIYDEYSRVTAYKLNDKVLYTATYDQYGRASTIEYPEAKDATTGTTLKLTGNNYDDLQRGVGSTMQLGNGQALTETVNLSQQTSKITGATQTLGSQSISQGYSYDRIGRMTSATVGNTKFDYGFEVPDSMCDSQAGNNTQAHKNSNRTTQTVTNLTDNSVVSQSKYCYDLADRLISSTDSQVGTPAYDDHGNTVSLSGNGSPITFGYDANDTNISIEQGANKVEYLKTSDGTVLRKKEYTNGELTKSYRYVAGGRILQSCDVANENACGNLDTYIGLAGGVTMTVSPDNPEANQQTKYSLTNSHGDTVLILDKQAHPISGLMASGPFGESLTGPAEEATNATDQVMGWAASPSRKREQSFDLPIIQMGARVYLPTMGRFLQVDPIQGGGANAYVYAVDPVNSHDYSGQNVVFTWTVSSGFCLQSCNNVAKKIQPAAKRTVLAKPRPQVRIVVAKPKPAPTIRVKKPAPIKPAAKKKSLPSVAAAALSKVVDIAGDAADGIGRQSSVFGKMLQKGSSLAGKNLRSVSSLAKNPIVRGLGSRLVGLAGIGIDAAGNHLEGVSPGRNALETGGGALGAAGGAFAGSLACGTAAALTLGLGAATCPALMAGGGALGSAGGGWLGKKAADWFGW